MDSGTVWSIVTMIATATFVVVVLSQCRRPWGWVGRLMIWRMNLGHSKLTDWGLSHVAISDDFTILDMGCGGGRTVQKLAVKASHGKVYGADCSKSSVAAARSRNQHSIEDGSVGIVRSTVSSLPFPDTMFDLVTAVETHYYWPDLVADLGEIRRTLKRGGRLIVIAETYKGRKDLDGLFQVTMKILGGDSLTADEHREAFESAGFSEVEVFEEPKKGWICCVGTAEAVVAR